MNNCEYASGPMFLFWDWFLPNEIYIFHLKRNISNFECSKTQFFLQKNFFDNAQYVILEKWNVWTEETTLTHFVPLTSLYTPWKHQKTNDFLKFSGGIGRDQCSRLFSELRTLGLCYLQLLGKSNFLRVILLISL